MKVLHALYSGLGGHGSVFFSMVQADKQHELEFEAVFNGIEDIREEYKARCTAAHIPFRFIKKFPGKHLSFYRQLYAAFREAKADIIFLHGSMAIPAAVIAGLHNRRQKIFIRETQAMHLKTRFDKIAFNLGMRYADRMVFLSDAYKAEARHALGDKFIESKTLVIPNGIDLDFFSPGSRIFDSRQVVIGMQSRLVPIKDHVTLIDAMALLEKEFPGKYTLRIAGDGESRASLEEQVKALGLQHNIVFDGMLDENRLPGFLQELDIYVHASLGETMSTAIMQAMGCALPIIASDVDGINNMITNEVNGLLVPVRDPRGLADMIAKLADSQAERDMLSQGARLHAEAYFSNIRMFQTYLKAFKGAQ